MKKRSLLLLIAVCGLAVLRGCSGCARKEGTQVFTDSEKTYEETGGKSSESSKKAGDEIPAEVNGKVRVQETPLLSKTPIPSKTPEALKTPAPSKTSAPSKTPAQPADSSVSPASENTGAVKTEESQKPGDNGDTVRGSSEDRTTKEPSAPASPQQVHIHQWQSVTSVVEHPASGHNEQRLVREAYDEPVYESQPVYREYSVLVCSGCGAEFDSAADIGDHIEYVHDMAASYFAQTRREPTGEYHDVIVGNRHYDALYETVWVEDTPKWTETVVTGYVCSCGAVKS